MVVHIITTTITKSITIIVFNQAPVSSSLSKSIAKEATATYKLQTESSISDTD